MWFYKVAEWGGEMRRQTGLAAWRLSTSELLIPPSDLLIGGPAELRGSVSFPDNLCSSDGDTHVYVHVKGWQGKRKWCLRAATDALKCTWKQKLCRTVSSRISIKNKQVWCHMDICGLSEEHLLFWRLFGPFHSFLGQSLNIYIFNKFKNQNSSVNKWSRLEKLHKTYF